MNNLLQIKHWQLFILIFLPIIIVDTIDNDIRLFDLLGSLWTTIVYLSWLYSIILKTNKIKSIPRFMYLAFIVCKYILILFILSALFLYGTNNNGYSFYWVVPALFAGLIAMFYILYFTAYCLVKSEKMNIDVFATFLAFWFFPIGVFIIQPRINKILINLNHAD